MNILRRIGWYALYILVIGPARMLQQLLSGLFPPPTKIETYDELTARLYSDATRLDAFKRSEEPFSLVANTPEDDIAWGITPDYRRELERGKP